MSKNSKLPHPGSVIKLYRKMKFLTQQEVADFVGVTQQQYQKYEYWKSKPSYKILDKLIKTLEIPPEKLFNVKTADFSEQFDKKIEKYGPMLKLIENDPKLLKMIRAYGKSK